MFECNPNGVEKIAKVIKEKMENALKLSVPVKVDLKSGKSWGEMSPVNVD
jgi:DNA polymerase I-like protein with 3'-5' exonuclease and polymerase domains